MTATIAWNPEHTLNQPEMDRTHHEFVDRLGALQEAVRNAPHEADDCLDELLRHTRAHFEQEDRWMQALGFDAQNCHALQHASVLEVMVEARRRHAQAQDLGLLQTLVQALDEWFAVHAPSMDAGLALVMQEQGFDPATGLRAAPAAAAAPAMTGCGSARCSG